MEEPALPLTVHVSLFSLMAIATRKASRAVATDNRKSEELVPPSWETLSLPQAA